MWFRSLIVAGCMACFFASADTIQFAGVNLAGAEFGQSTLPGTYNTHYTYPTQQEVDYFRGRGMNIIRLPFRWERLQRTNNANFDVPEFNRLHGFVSATTAKGVYVMVEPHNFARYWPNPASNYQGATMGLLGTTVPYSAFSNFWFRVADIYKTNDHVIFNLMNEPANMVTENWLEAANAAIAGIRNTGATNLILVPGNGYTGAWTWSQNWYGTANAQVMLDVVDPANNYAYDVHQYLDSDGSGTTTNIGSTNIGVTRLSGFTQWLKDNNRKGFLGEFAVANSTIGTNASLIGDETLTNMLNHINDNADVWLGWAWWAAGPWWGNYMFTLEPANISIPVDRPAMTVLRNFIPTPTPALQLANANQFRFTSQSGFSYQPEASPDMSAWTNYGSSTNGTGLSITITMPTESGEGGFFRVRVTQLP